jgi:5-(hydroxymethyl)furfural/furfural oxidase
LDGNVSARQVVLSAGAIHSPAILLRSGLDTLRPAIGRNLAEHPRVTAYVTVDQSVIDSDGDSPSIGFILRWSSGVSGCGEADLQMLGVNHAEPNVPGLILVLAAVMEPFSRGAVTLVSDDPAVDPRVEFRLLSDPRDAARIRLAAAELFAVLTNDAVRTLNPTVTLDDNGTTPDDLAEEGALDTWLRKTVSDYVHACGSCRMGSPEDPSAVVDPFCRFIGIEGLYVVDASIIRVIPRANTNLTAVMIGERAASFLIG